MLSTDTVKDMDQEWLELILEAKRIGLTIGEVRDFLDQSGVVESKIENP